MISAAPEVHEAGSAPGSGTFSCVRCGSQLSLEATDLLPECPCCEGSAFRRSSIFDQSFEPHPGATIEFEAPGADGGEPDWLPAVRSELTEGRHLACCEEGEPQVFALKPGWTRIGRSANADIRLDDPTVSRRHALVVWEPGLPLRVLDDRSLNGILINGELTEWGRLEDGDHLVIGRFRLHLLQV